MTLDGSGSRASTRPALQASEELGTLPGGTSLAAKLRGLDSDGRVQGSVDIGTGPAAQNTSVAYVVDVSGSTDSAGGQCGNPNGDRSSNTILDCELAAALKLHEEVVSAGNVDKVALIKFSNSASALDLDPTSAVATLVSPTADKDGDGVLDVVEAIRSVTGSGGTNFLPPTTMACQMLATTGSPHLVTAFLSDGEGSGKFSTALPCSPPVTFHAFAVGANSKCTKGSAGSRLQVVRSYDSFDKGNGDFGVGWRVDVADFRIQRTIPLGQGGWKADSDECGLIFCTLRYTSTTPHMVSVVWPDGRQEVFDMVGVDGSTFFPGMARAKFEPRKNSGTTSTLTVEDDSLFFVGDTAHSGAFGSGPVFDPQVFTLTDVSGTEYVIDRGKGLRTMTARSGDTLTFNRDGVRSSMGKEIVYTRDGQDRITKITSPAGTTTYGYDHGDLVSSVDLAGVTTTYEYDGDHNLTNVVGPGGVSLGRTEYDADGRLVAWIDAEGNRTEIGTDLGANQERVTDPTGRLTTVTTYDDAGDKVREDKVSGGQTLTTRWTYDTNHQMLSQTDPLGQTISVTRDAKGMITSRTDAAGRTWELDYNTWGQPVSYEGPGGVGDYAWTYDNRGNMLIADPAVGPTVSMAYSGSHLTSVKRGSETMATFTYRASGNGAGKVETITDTHGKTLTLAYDATGQVLSETDSTGTVSYAYDAHGQVVERVNQVGGKRTWSYGDRGELLAQTDELGRTTRSTYDDALRQVSRTDRNGVTTTFAHDAAGRVIRQASPDSVLTFKYDGLGRQVEAAKGDVVTELGYDQASRVTSRVTTGPGLPRIGFDYTHCECGAVESVTGPGGTTTYDYDDATGQLAQVSAPDGGEFGFTWDLAGRLSKMTRPNDVAEVLEWNEAGMLASRNQVAADGSDVSKVSYGYDAGGRRTSMTDDSGRHTFSYDAAGNLTGADHPEGSEVADESFTYDKQGNRTSAADNPAGSMVYDAANRLVRDAKHDYTYDGEGNLTSKKVRASGATTRYVWDSEHRLVDLVKPSGATVRYRYDAAGMRVQATRSSDGRVTTWGYNGSTVAAVWRQEVGGPRVLVSTFVTAPSGDPLQSTADGETVYGVLDGLGSVTGTLDAAGGVASSSAYSVFGQPAGTGAVGLGDAFGYTGHAWDGDAGMHFARARWYDAGVGRFASEDPVDAMNLYSYVGNQPLSFVDPTGEMMFEYNLMGDLGGAAVVGSMILVGAIGDRVMQVWDDLWRDQQCLHMNVAGASIIVGVC